MKHSVLKKSAVSNLLTSSANESTRKYYFARNRKIRNQIVVQLKTIVKMAKSDEVADSVAVNKKNSNKQQSNKEKQKPPTKVVIRHLPPTMTEEEFLKQIDPLPAHDFYYFASADWSLGFDATCRAYITLKNYDDVFLFRDRFDGYVFVDAKGNEYAAIVEFAPFQGIVKNKSRRTDNKVNTIEEEAHYQQFLVKLAEEREIASKGGETKMEFNINAKKEEITSTPLLQYLANKKEKRRLEAKKRVEEKRKQRDEDREKRQENVKEQQVTAILTEVGGGLKKEQKPAGEVEEKQNSRSKRRIERNQKRQEAFLQRKMQDKATKSTESVQQNSVTENQQQQQEQQKEKEKSDQCNQRDKKESRRERDRERERERNRQRRERREKAKELSKSNNNMKTTPKILTKKDGEDLGAVQQNSPDRSENKADEETKKQSAAEERRIRNKDRPSIAIYQPKARLRQSEESDTGGNNSGEHLIETKKSEDTVQVKKVSRYSERRKRSSAKEKRKSSATDEDIIPKEEVVNITADTH